MIEEKLPGFSELDELRLKQVLQTLNKRYTLHDEKLLQMEIAAQLTQQKEVFEREYSLNGKDIIDFVIPHIDYHSQSGIYDYTKLIGIEVKIKGHAKSIYKQCQRYCQHPLITALILVTGRSMGFPQQINNKPCYVVNISKAWL